MEIQNNFDVSNIESSLSPFSTNYKINICPINGIEQIGNSYFSTALLDCKINFEKIKLFDLSKNPVKSYKSLLLYN